MRLALLVELANLDDSVDDHALVFALLYIRAHAHNHRIPRFVDVFNPSIISKVNLVVLVEKNFATTTCCNVKVCALLFPTSTYSFFTAVDELSLIASSRSLWKGLRGSLGATGYTGTFKGGIGGAGGSAGGAGGAAGGAGGAEPVVRVARRVVRDVSTAGR